MSIALLRLVLLVRCAVCVIFAWKLSAAAPMTFLALVGFFQPFAVADGILGVALAPLVLAASWGGRVAAVALFDGLLSLVWGAVLHWWPGIPYFSVTVVLFTGLLSALSGAIGLLQLALAAQLRRRSGSTVIGFALGVLGALFIVLAVLDFWLDVTPGATRKLLAAQALLQAVAFAVIAVASRRGRQWVTARTWSVPTQQ